MKIASDSTPTISDTFLVDNPWPGAFSVDTVSTLISVSQ